MQGVDLLGRNEVAELDRARELDVETVEVARLEGHEAALLDLEGAHHLLGRNVVACESEVASIDEANATAGHLDGGVEPHVDVPAPEGDRATPKGLRCHAARSPSGGLGKRRGLAARPP